MSFQVLIGFKSFVSTPSIDKGTLRFNPGTNSVSMSSSSPSWMALTILLVVGILNLEPIPYGPPVHPVLTKNTLEPKDTILLIKRSAYSLAGLGKKGAPKQVEKVDSISALEPTSVEPTFAVYPLKK